MNSLPPPPSLPPLGVYGIIRRTDYQLAVTGVRSQVVARRQHAGLGGKRELPLPVGRQHEREGERRSPLPRAQASHDPGAAPGGGEGACVVSVPEALARVGGRYR